MSYQVLARKWRPAKFADVAGQGHVLKSLINALDNQRLHHAYLFTGTRGVGKTTLARILAKCLNCEEGISSEPCGKCAACLEINDGRFIDLIEVDAASRTKVEDTRELLENVQYAPGRGRFKVYLIDEVHMLSNHSFNALLKTLEEPPEHVKFLFATTDPQKLPITVLSRCLQFNLKNLSQEVIVEYLQKVLQEESIKYDEDALWQIAAAAAGSMRDALTLTDQAISYCQGEVAKVGVIEMLGVPEQQQVFAVLEQMSAGDIGAVLKLVNEISDRTPDYAHTLDSILSCLHRLAIAQAAPAALDNSFGDQEELQKLAGKFSAEDIQLFYQIGVEGRRDLKAGIDVRSAFEMLLIRMMVFSPTLVNDDLKSTLPGASGADAPAEPEPEPESELKKKPGINDPDKSAPPADPPDAQTPEAGRAETDETEPQPTESATDRSEKADGADKTKKANTGSAGKQEPGIEEGGAESAQDDAPESGSEKKRGTSAQGTAPEAGLQQKDGATDQDAASTAATNGNAGATLQNLDHEAWLKLLPKLPSSGMAANVLLNSVLVGVEGEELSFRLDKSQSAVYSDELIPKIETLLSDFFGQRVKVNIEISVLDADKETAAKMAVREKAEAHSDMVQQFEQDSNVQQLVNRFSGRIAVDSITPREEQRE